MKQHTEQNYLDLLKKILEEGEYYDDRTGVGCYSLFGPQLHYDISETFPLFTTRPTPFKTMTHETLWFLKGTGNCDYLDENNVKIWKEWTEPKTNSVGPMYGVQLRKWLSSKETIYNEFGQTLKPEIDQLGEVIEAIRKEVETGKHSRRHVITLWNPSEQPDTSISPIDNVKIGNPALSACHGVVIQFFVNLKTKSLSLKMYQRSSDLYLAGGFNTSQYALLCYMVAHLTGLKPKELIMTYGDVHIYSNQVDVVKELITREPLPYPTLEIVGEVNSIDDFTIDNFKLNDYQHHPALAKIKPAV